MIRNKAALIISAIILCICMYLYFPFPNNLLIDASIIFMSFPIRNQDGYIVHGIIGSVLFIIAVILPASGMKKYHFRTIALVILVFTIVPNLLITVYQETLARGIAAISYDGEGKCNFDSVGENLLNGECDFVLQNRSNEVVTFELEFLDSHFIDDGERMESLMNFAGPYSITIGANHKKSIHLEKLLNVSDVPNHITWGTSHKIHFKLMDGKASRTL